MTAAILMAPVVDGARWPVIIDERDKKKPREGLLTTPPAAIRKDVYTRGARSFGSMRDSGKRRSVGVTLFGAQQGLVVAPLAGQVLRFGSWQDSTWIVYLRTEHCIFGIGGIERGSWQDFQVGENTSLRAGHVIAACSKFSYGVHFQTWARPQGLGDADFIEMSRSGALRWWTAKGPPPLLFNPTDFLLACGGHSVP